MSEVQPVGVWFVSLPGDVGPPPVSRGPLNIPQCVCQYDRASATIEIRLQQRGAVKPGGGRTCSPCAVQQCMACGKKLMNVKTTPEQKLTLKPFDESLRQRVGKERWLVINRLQEERKAAREAWWVWYDAYLQSPKWKVIRERIMTRDRKTCRVQGCGQPATQVHHLTYERVGNEADADLVSVCDGCHEKIHPHRFGGGQ